MQQRTTSHGMEPPPLLPIPTPKAVSAPKNDKASHNNYLYIKNKAIVSVSILFMHFKPLKSKHFGLIERKKPSLSTSPPTPNSVLLPEVWLLLCAEYLCTQTQTPRAHLGSWPKHRCHAGHSKVLRPRQWAQQNSTGVLITELRAQENWQKRLILRRFSPSP